jgi:hypothetical protein
MEVPAETVRRILIVDSDPKQLRRLTQILHTVIPDPVAVQEMPENIFDGSYALAVVNYDGLASDERRRIIDTPKARRVINPVLISEGAIRQDYFALFQNHVLTNLIARNREVDAEELIVTAQKLLRGEMFGIEKYFVWGVVPLVAEVRNSAEKDQIIQFAEEYVKRMGVNPRFAYLFAKVADELVTNGLYNAPIDRQGRRRFASTNRQKEIQVEPGEEVTVQICSDGRWLGISATDPFGSLDPATLLDHLSRCFRKGEDRPLDKPGGAGLGFYYIYESCSHFVTNISRGRATQMMGFIDIQGSYRDFAEQNKSFNIFIAQ